jgi:CRISP-associated protein Cas1
MSATTDRIVDITDSGYHISVENCQLVLAKKGEFSRRTIPISELAVLIVSNLWTTYSHAALCSLAESKAFVIICDNKSLPTALLLPMQGHTLQAERLRLQIEAPNATNKRLWRQIVQAKIAGQSQVLLKLHGNDDGLNKLPARVGSGDTENVEGQAARRYWPQLFRDNSFRREPMATESPNCLLNYGYAVLRAITARALVGAGLCVPLGIHHHHRENTFCLVDDMMEPFRPIVDLIVASVANESVAAVPLDKETKKKIVTALLGRIEYDGEMRTLFDVLSKVANELITVFEGNSSRLVLPEPSTMLQIVDDHSVI